MKRSFEIQDSNAQPSQSSNTSIWNSIISFPSTILGGMNTVYRQFNPSPVELKTFFPDDLLQYLMSMLTLSELCKMEQVSMRHRAVASTNWKEHCQFTVPVGWGTQDLSDKEKVLQFSNLCVHLTQIYPGFLLNVFPVEHIASMPLLSNDKGMQGIFEIGTVFQDGNYNSLSLLYGHYIYDKKEHSFIRLCVTIDSLDEKMNKQILPMVIHLDEEKLDYPGEVLPRTDDILPRRDLEKSPNALEYLWRLVQNKPCGQIKDGKEVEPKVTETGKPLVQLCDETGKVVHFNSEVKKFRPL